MSNYNTEFDVFPTQKMAQIERKSERTINRIDPINDQITKYYFDQISAHWSLIDRVIGSENERDLSNPGLENVWEHSVTSTGYGSCPSTMPTRLCCSSNSQVANFHRVKLLPLNLAIWLTSLSVEFIFVSADQVRSGPITCQKYSETINEIRLWGFCILNRIKNSVHSN